MANPAGRISNAENAAIVVLLAISLSNALTTTDDAYDDCCITNLRGRCGNIQSDVDNSGCGASKILFGSRCSGVKQDGNIKICLKDTSLTIGNEFDMASDSKLSGYRSPIKLTGKVNMKRKAVAFFPGNPEQQGSPISYGGELTMKEESNFVIGPKVGLDGNTASKLNIGDGAKLTLTSKLQEIKVSIGKVEIEKGSKIRIQYEGVPDAKHELKDLLVKQDVSCEIYTKALREDGTAKQQGKIYYESNHPDAAEKCILSKTNAGKCFCEGEKERCCGLDLKRYIVTGGQKKRKIDTCYVRPFGSYADGSKITPSIDAAASARKCFFVSHININSIIMKSSSILDVQGSRFEVPIIKLSKKSNFIVHAPINRLEPDYQFVATSVVVGNKGNFIVKDAVNTNFDKVEVGARGFLAITGDGSVNVTETPSFNATGKIDIEPGSGLKANLTDGDIIELTTFKARRAGLLALGPIVQFTASDKIVLLENAKLRVKGKVSMSSIELKVNAELNIDTQVSKVYPKFFNLMSEGKIILEESARMEVKGVVWATIKSASIGVESKLHIDASKHDPLLPGKINIKDEIVLEDDAQLKIEIGPRQTVRFSHITVVAGFKCTMCATGSSFVKGAVTITAKNITKDVRQECIITEYTRTTTTNDPNSRKPTPINGKGTNDLDINRNFTEAISVICSAVVVGLVVYLIIRHRQQQQQQQQALAMQLSGMSMAGQPAQPFVQQPVKQPTETPLKSAAETQVKTKNDAVVKPSIGKKADEVKPATSKPAEAVHGKNEQQVSPLANATQHADSE